MIMGWHGAALLARSAWLNVVGQNQPKSCSNLIKVEIRKDLVPVPASEMNEYEGGSIINRMVRKISARRSDPARLHSSRHLGWAMVGDAKSRKCKKSIHFLSVW